MCCSSVADVESFETVLELNEREKSHHLFCSDDENWADLIVGCSASLEIVGRLSPMIFMSERGELDWIWVGTRRWEEGEGHFVSSFGRCEMKK